MTPDMLTLTLPDGRTVRPGKLLCIGRNYAAHVREMGDVAVPSASAPADPVVFLKPTTALIADGGEIVLPRQSQDVHHELELVAVIGTGGRHIAEAQALGHVAAYALGLDLTARDLQAESKASKGPWSIAKGFDTFAPLGPLLAADALGDPQCVSMRLSINGETRQDGVTGDMISSVARIVSFLSSVFTLEPGDLIYTGTPEGVGPVRDGDRLVASGGRVLNVTALGDSVTQAKAAAYHAVDAIDFADGFCRRDIGWREVAREAE